MNGIKIDLDRNGLTVYVTVDEDLWKNKSQEELLTAIEKEIAVAFRKESYGKTTDSSDERTT